MDGGTIGSRPHRFTVTDYHRMAQVGILGEDSRVELIRGQIVDMAPIGASHLGMVNRLTRLLIVAVAGHAVVSVQNPVHLDDGSEPEPDLAVLKPRADDYSTATPRSEDVLLLIEVSDSTLQHDREIKVPLYAENTIPECWLVDLTSKTVEVHRQPEDGRYGNVSRVGTGGILDIATLSGVTLAVSDLFGLSQDGDDLSYGPLRG